MAAVVRPSTALQARGPLMLIQSSSVVTRWQAISFRSMTLHDSDVLPARAFAVMP